MGVDTQVRHGAGKLFVKDYPSGTYAEVDVDQSEDGLEFNFSGETKDVKSAQQTGGYKRLLFGESASLKIGVLERNMDMIARAFAHAAADVVDNALEFGGPRNLKEMTIKVECPQPVDPTLDDILTLFRVTAKPEYSEAYKVGQERVIPVVFEALANMDVAVGTVGALGSLVSEYTA